MSAPGPDFVGAKIVLLIGGRLLTLLRDDIPTISYPGWWDMPGGGREGAESPEACVLRETREEFGLALDPGALAWRGAFDSPTTGGQSFWFAASLAAEVEREIVFGDEGQGWLLMSPEAWLAHPRAVPHFKSRVRAGLAGLAAAGLRNEAENGL
ncbi:MAG: NUDIX hydrolase [Maritimibacter sp.]|nr:NUDIX hydrolase [Maritimibacter sp.]